MAKEVGTKNLKTSVRENSFGSAPAEVSLSRGSMAKFGHTYNDKVWPKDVDSVDVKSGFPENRSMGGGKKS
jgi:hypothetical protein